MVPRIDTGSVQDFIVGMHIIAGPGNHIYLERASYPVVSDAFIQKFKTKLVTDDEPSMQPWSVSGALVLFMA